MRGGLSVGIALALLLLWSPAGAGAQAEETPDEDSGSEGGTEAEVDREGERRAQTHFEAGRNHYEAGAYEAAIREFEAAYELSPRPLLLYNLYLTHERAGNLQVAADTLRRYLAEGEIEPDKRQTLQTRLKNLERRLEADAASAADDDDEDEAAQDAAADDEDASGTTAPAPDEGGGGGVPTSAVVSFVVGGVGLATFAVFAGLSESEDQSVANDCGLDVGKSCSDDDVSTLRTYNIVADVALGVGLAAAATGVILWLVDDGDDSQAGDVAVAPWLGRERAGAAAEVRF